MKTRHHRAERPILKEYLRHFSLHAAGAVICVLLMLAILPLAAGCHPKPKAQPKRSPLPDPDPQLKVKLVVANASIERFDSDMHYAVLRINGHIVPAWWDTTTEIHRGNQLWTEWAGHPGDHIKISAVEANDELYLRKVWMK
jgi:hypothetical protein